jgi:hypothetical protein
MWARRVPAVVWAVLAAGLALWAVYAWASGKIEARVEAAHLAGRAEQAAADTAAFEEAQRLAEARQAALNARIAGQEAAVSRRVSDAVSRALGDVRRDADDLRLRWTRARAGSAGDAGGGGVPGVAGAAARAADAACAAGGGVSFDAAISAMIDAESDAARLRGWQDWWRGIEEVDRR